MKKLFYLLSLLALFVACRQEDPVGESARIVFANQVEELTRGDNTLTTANLVNFDVWAHNDNGVVFDGTRVEKQGDLWVSAVEKMWEEKQGYYFHAFAPSGAVSNVGEYPNAERARGLGNFAYTNAGDKDLIYAYATRVQGSLLKINADPVQLEFEHLLSRVQFTFKNNLSEGNITITNVQIKEAAKTAELNCGDASIANWTWNATSTGAYDFGATGTIAKGASASAENVQFLFPAATRNYDISFSIAYESDAAEERTATISNVNLVMGKSYNVNLVVNDKDVVTEEYKIEFFVAEVKDWGSNIELDATINEPGHGFENGYEWVDLGLSVKWATCNVGATKPEEYGDYFAWGEVEPKRHSGWDIYKYCEGTENTLTKYCCSSGLGNNGFIDDKIVLDPEDDAAHVNWGGAWRMPTYDELDELIMRCTWTWITQNEINGYKIIGLNGNSIFLPAAGSKTDNQGNVSCVGSEIHYWSSSLDIGSPNYAHVVCNIWGRVNLDVRYQRCSGLSIRPVCE
ncbi:MAG: fimbrillin family protein [Paludibacteraceae bacterium]|nr:fimbrillin family protein [Paludibacteraceae bacterium]